MGHPTAPLPESASVGGVGLADYPITDFERTCALLTCDPPGDRVTAGIALERSAGTTAAASDLSRCQYLVVLSLIVRSLRHVTANRQRRPKQRVGCELLALKDKFQFYAL